MRKLGIPRVAPAIPRAARRAGDDYGATDPPDWRSLDWPGQLRSLDLLGAPVTYVDLGPDGDEPPIVFVHGLGGQWQNWLENLPRFAATRRVVALDLPGFGGSPVPREPIAIELFGRVVTELCRQLELGPAVLVGNSMGGFVAAEVAIQAPEAVERLMLVSAAGVSQMDIARRPVTTAARAAGLLFTGNVAPLRAVAVRPRTRHAGLALVVRHPTALRADTVYEGLIKGTGKPGFESALGAVLDYDFRERLGKIGCPTLVVWGNRDMIIPVADADRFVELIPGARKVIIEDTGHVPQIERPPTFNALLHEFLSYAISHGEVEGELDAESGASSAPEQRV